VVAPKKSRATPLLNRFAEASIMSTSVCVGSSIVIGTPGA